MFYKKDKQCDIWWVINWGAMLMVDIFAAGAKARKSWQLSISCAIVFYQEHEQQKK